MAWFILITAGLIEVGWPLGLEMAQRSPNKFSLLSASWLVFSVFCMILSFFLLVVAQRSIPLGTSYAVWTSIGAVGTFLAWVIFFGDALSLTRTLAIIFIVAGVAMLKVAH